MVKKLTVRTIKAKAQVEIQPDASAPIAVAVPVAGSAPAPSQELFQNPFENQSTPSESYVIAGICGIIASLLVIGLLVVQGLEWQEYHGGFTPVFPKMMPAGQMPAAMPPAAE